MKDVFSLSAGFLAGAIVGFLWSQGAKQSIANGVETDFTNGKLTVSVDAKQAAVYGFTNILN